MIKAIVFDVDDTLYSQSQPFDLAFADLIEGKYDVDSDALFKSSKKHLNERYHSFMRGEMTLQEINIHRMQAPMKEFGYDYSDEECLEFQEAYARHQKNIALSEPLKTMLAYLKERVTIGVITNGQSAHQHYKIDLLGLQDWFDEEYMIVSSDTPYAKPDPRIFQIMEERMGFQPDEFIYVGDALLNDMQGAKSAGWNTIYLNRREPAPDPSNKNVDYMATTEEELLELVKKLVK